MSIPRFLIANISNPDFKKFAIEVVKHTLSLKSGFFDLEKSKYRVFSLKPVILVQKIVFFDYGLPWKNVLF